MSNPQQFPVVAIGSGDLTGQKATVNSQGQLLVSTTGAGSASPSTTQPTVPTATSTTILAANPVRKYFEIQNNSAANIMISISGATLTGIVPTASNIGFVLVPGATYYPTQIISTSAITAYQTSGSTINTISVLEE